MSVPQRRSLYDCLNDRLRADARLGLARDSAAMAGGAAGPLLYRDGREYISFMSNDGLGLAADAHWQARVAACFAAHAPSASASRLAGGRSDVVDQACRAVADYFGFAECLFLPSGYQANLACVTTLLQQGQEAFVDRRCHASVMRALPLAGARIRAWNHLDYDHLERLLSSLPPDAPQPVVMAESLYSMDGAALDLERMAALRRRYGFFLCVDEAHALGALGPGGRGLCAAQALRDGGRAPADLVVGTLGKSLGLWGAFLLLPRGFTPLFEHLASAIMHSTALPPAHAACMLALVEELPRLEERRRTLAARVAFFPPYRAGRPCCVSASPPAIRKNCWPARLQCCPGCGKARDRGGGGRDPFGKGALPPPYPLHPPKTFVLVWPQVPGVGSQGGLSSPDRSTGTSGGRL